MPVTINQLIKAICEILYLTKSRENARQNASVLKLCEQRPILQKRRREVGINISRQNVLRQVHERHDRHDTIKSLDSIAIAVSQLRSWQSGSHERARLARFSLQT